MQKSYAQACEVNDLFITENGVAYVNIGFMFQKFDGKRETLHPHSMGYRFPAPEKLSHSDILTFTIDTYYDIIDELRHHLNIMVDGNYLNMDDKIFLEAKDLKDFLVTKKKIEYYWILWYLNADDVCVLKTKGE